MKKNLSLVILCGGKGKRLGNITKKIPKPLIQICNKPFMEHLINFYQKYNFKNIYLIGHYKSQKFKKIFNKKNFNFIKCLYVKEEKPLDTGGALNVIRNKIKNDFVLVNGDSYLDYDFIKFDKFHNTHNLHSMILTKNINYKSNNKLNKLRLENKTVKFGSNYKYMNSGIYYFKKSIFRNIKKNTPVSLEKDILPLLIKKNKMKGIIDNNFFIDIGIKKNLKFAKENFKKIIYKPAIFLDRDGVLNEDIGHFCEVKKIKWIRSLLNILNKISKKYRLFIVTNQSGIARGYFTKNQFVEFQKQYQILLNSKNIFIDDIRYCPHHPDKGINKFKKKCNCRKPNNGMIKDLIKYWDVDIKKSFMIGDQKSDFLAAKKSNLKFFYNEKNNYLSIKKNLINS